MRAKLTKKAEKITEKVIFLKFHQNSGPAPMKFDKKSKILQYYLFHFPKDFLKLPYNDPNSRKYLNSG